MTLQDIGMSRQFTFI